jgi:hypothetical protein
MVVALKRAFLLTTNQMKRLLLIPLSIVALGMPAMANPKLAAETYCALLTAGGSVKKAENAAKDILVNYRLQSTTRGMSVGWLDPLGAAFASREDYPATKAFIYVTCGELHMERNLYEKNGEYKNMRDKYNELVKIEPKTEEQKIEIVKLETLMKEMRDKKKAKDIGG